VNDQPSHRRPWRVAARWSKWVAQGGFPELLECLENHRPELLLAEGEEIGVERSCAESPRNSQQEGLTKRKRPRPSTFTTNSLWCSTSRR